MSSLGKWGLNMNASPGHGDGSQWGKILAGLVYDDSNMSEDKFREYFLKRLRVFDTSHAESFIASQEAKKSKAKASGYSPNTSFEKGILARIEAAKLTTGGSGQDDSSIASKTNKVIYDGLKYEHPDYVDEAKRRKLMSSDCNKYLDIKTATPEKPSSTTATTKASQPTKDGNFKKRLRELKKLVDEGLITPDEAATKRKEILNSL